MRVHIITDSAADMAPAVYSRVEVVPMTIRFGQEEFIDGVTLDTPTFYEKLTRCAALPATSQPSPAAFGAVFEKIAQAGDSAVVITVAAKLSGTYQSAAIAAGAYPGRVAVVDSETVTIAQGILVEHALALADAGMEAKEIAARLTALRRRVSLVAVVDTLEYLHKGGRISKTVAIAGGLLAIKPVIRVEAGELKLVGKARGGRQAYAALNREIDSLGGVDFSKPVMLGYTGRDSGTLQKYVEESAGYWGGKAFPSAQVGCTVGVHAGPGAIAAAFFVKE